MARTLLEETSPTEKTSTLGLSRLYSSRKSSGRPSTSDGSTPSSLRNGLRSASESDPKKRDMERGKSLEKMRDPEKGTPKVKPTELKEADVPPRKQTRTPLDGRGSRGPNALKPGESIVEQIGHPDHEGWMRKKGDHYNSWKLRYFIIKGPHLYILRSNSKAVSRFGERGVDAHGPGAGNEDQGICQYRRVQGRCGREHRPWPLWIPDRP